MSNQPGNYGGAISTWPHYRLRCLFGAYHGPYPTVAPPSDHVVQELVNIKVVLTQMIGEIQSTNSRLERGFTDMASILTNIERDHLQVRRDTVELLRVAYSSRPGDSM